MHAKAERSSENEASETSPASTSTACFQPPEQPEVCLSFWLLVACGEADLVIDTHPLVKISKNVSIP